MPRTDGLKPGTNYNHTTGSSRADVARSEISALAAQRARCAKGEHAEAVAGRNRVTWSHGQRLTPGTRYCRCCGVIPHDAKEATNG